MLLNRLPGFHLCSLCYLHNEPVLNKDIITYLLWFYCMEGGRLKSSPWGLKFLRHHAVAHRATQEFEPHGGIQKAAQTLQLWNSNVNLFLQHVYHQPLDCESVKVTSSGKHPSYGSPTKSSGQTQLYVEDPSSSVIHWASGPIEWERFDWFKSQPKLLCGYLPHFSHASIMISGLHFWCWSPTKPSGQTQK